MFFHGLKIIRKLFGFKRYYYINMSTGIMIFFVTAPNIEVAEQLAKGIIENKIAACVNIIPNITSVYRWRSEIEIDQEYFMILKTTSIKSEQLKKYIENNHPYENPECIGLNIETGLENYTNWIFNSVK